MERLFVAVPEADMQTDEETVTVAEPQLLIDNDDVADGVIVELMVCVTEPDVDPHIVGDREPDGERVGDREGLAEPQVLAVNDAVGEEVKVALVVGVKVPEAEPHPEGVKVALTDSVTVSDADPHGEGDREPDGERVGDREGLAEPQVLAVNDAVGDEVKVALPL